MLTPEEALDQLADQVTALVAAGVLSGDQGSGLTTKLESVLEKLATGKTQPAINQRKRAG